MNGYVWGISPTTVGGASYARASVTSPMVAISMSMKLVWIADEMRNHAQQKAPPYSTHAIVRACFPEALVTGARLPKGIHECVSIHNGLTTIVYERSLPVPAQRFAIAHAICHLVFDAKSVGARPGFMGCPLAERRADEFAAELLVPRRELFEMVSHWPSRDLEEHEIYLDHVDELASRFAVPSSVIDGCIRSAFPVRKSG